MNREVCHFRASLSGGGDLRFLDMWRERCEHMAIDVTFERYRQIKQPVW